MARYELGWELEKNYPVKSIGQLRRLFYRDHVYREPGKSRLAVNPIGLVMNPPQFISEYDLTAIDTWIAVYGSVRFSPTARFYVAVEHHPKSMSGPHIAKLHIQLYPGKEGAWQCKYVWLGTAQFECNFFDEKKIRVNLKRAIRLKEYYASLQSEGKVVTFDEPRPIVTSFH